MWKKNTAYDPARLGAASARGLADPAEDAATVAAAMRVEAVKAKQRIGSTLALRVATAAAAKEVAGRGVPKTCASCA